MAAGDSSVDAASGQATVERNRDWLRRWTEEQRKARLLLRRDFFVDSERDDIPDLVFETPECPICFLHTSFDDGSFTCEECCVTWPRSGYGQQAEVHDDAPFKPGPAARQGDPS